MRVSTFSNTNEDPDQSDQHVRADDERTREDGNDTIAEGFYEREILGSEGFRGVVFVMLLVESGVEPRVVEELSVDPILDATLDHHAKENLERGHVKSGQSTQIEEMCHATVAADVVENAHHERLDEQVHQDLVHRLLSKRRWDRETRLNDPFLASVGRTKPITQQSVSTQWILMG